MSDTPLTDAAALKTSRYAGKMGPFITTETARDIEIQLRKENNQLRETLKECAEPLHLLSNHSVELPSYLYKKITKVLSNPIIQQALKTTKDNNQPD